MSPAPRALRLAPEAAGERLDRAIARALGEAVSVREVRRALGAGRITVDGRRVAPGDRARPGLEVDLAAFVPRAEARVAPDPELAGRAPVLVAWADLVALDKPSGVACAPLEPGEEGTLLGAAIHHHPGIAAAGPPLEGGLLHRLDAGTSGVVLFALDGETRARGRVWFSRHEVEKTYLARVAPARLPAAVDAPIRPGARPDRVAVGPGAGALSARSELEVVRSSPDSLLVRVRTRFGRRHQVRAHLAHVGAPLLGDRLYGGPPAPRLMLHAEMVRLPDGREARAPAPGALA